MPVSPIRFPTTPEGWEALRNSIEVNGPREVYPDGSLLIDTDWDEVAAVAQAYAAFEKGLPA